MERIRLEFSDDQRVDQSDQKQFRNKMEWAEFSLLKRTINCLLGLFSISTVFTLAIGARIARGEGRPATFVIGSLMTGTVICIGRLLTNSLKLIRRQADRGFIAR